jgi:hypothetical protein
MPGVVWENWEVDALLSAYLQLRLQNKQDSIYR